MYVVSNACSIGFISISDEIFLLIVNASWFSLDQIPELKMEQVPGSYILDKEHFKFKLMIT